MLGVCYYPEHWPQARWREDAARMVDLGIGYVRVGEFAWSRIEPSRDDFRWDWLDEALAVLGGAGLKVVLGTPTATPPKWLVDARPEILAWDAEGRPRGFGSRRHYCFVSPAWREESERICAVLAERYGEHDAVAGWQLDNEYGCHDTVLSYAPHCRPAFQAWLEQRYGDVDALNDAWGNAFWSMEVTSFAQVDLPNLTVTAANPAHLLDYRRCMSDHVASYNRLQAETVRARSPGRFVAHNFMGFFHQFDHAPVARDLDVVAWDSYPLGFTNQRMGLNADERARFARTGHPDVAALHHDLYRGLGRGSFWVMEQQPGPVNWADDNPAPAPGMVRLWTWEALAHGAAVVSYFRWRQAPFAQEQMHAGLNRPDGALDTGGEEARRVAVELRDHALGAPEQAPVALMLDDEADWVYRIQPQGSGCDYSVLVRTWYTAARRLGVDVDVVRPGDPLDGYRLALVPSLPIVSDAALACLRACDGAVLVGPRSGSKTASFAIPPELPPGPLQSLLPLKVTRVESLPPGSAKRVRLGDNAYTAAVWRERVESAIEPLARFADGDGAVFVHDRWHYLAFWPDEGFLTAYLDGLLRVVGVPTRWLPETLRLRRRGDLTFAFNYGDEPVELPAPEGAAFVLGDRTLGPHDVAAWRHG